jgi:DeoR/GlpR family transcriptional regulator of sugar metabolism
VAAGVHLRAGLTAGDPDEAAMRRILVGRAADTYVVASIEKIGTVAPYAIIGLAGIAGLVTDAPADNPAVQQLSHQGVNIIQA